MVCQCPQIIVALRVMNRARVQVQGTSEGSVPARTNGTTSQPTNGAAAAAHALTYSHSRQTGYGMYNHPVQSVRTRHTLSIEHLSLSPQLLLLRLILEKLQNGVPLGFGIDSGYDSCLGTW